MQTRFQTRDRSDYCLICHWWMRCGPVRRREQEQSGKTCPYWRRPGCCKGNIPNK